MIQKDENTLHEMLYKKTNEVINLLQLWDQRMINDEVCIYRIKEQYLDTQFIELLNQKNDETHQAKN